MYLRVQYHRYIEIAIKQCRSSGIDCKIHGLSIVGRVRAEDEDLATVPFLASDNEEEEDEKTATGRCEIGGFSIEENALPGMSLRFFFQSLFAVCLERGCRG